MSKPKNVANKTTKSSYEEKCNEWQQLTKQTCSPYASLFIAVILLPAKVNEAKMYTKSTEWRGRETEREEN